MCFYGHFKSDRIKMIMMMMTVNSYWAPCYIRSRSWGVAIPRAIMAPGGGLGGGSYGPPPFVL